MASLNSIGGIHYEMMRRCYNEKSVAYKDYGAKGIKVCEEWHNREVFKKWASDNGYVKGLRLERINSKGDYEPNNCRFGRKCCKNNINYKMKLERINKKRQREKLGITGQIHDDEMYGTYRGMHNRCNEKGNKYYYEQGIKVCSEWSGKNGFINFKSWAINNGWEKGLTIDRINNNKGYNPNNCRWVTIQEQAKNKRRNILYDWNNKKMILSEISKVENVSYNALYNRIKKKSMTVEDAVKDIKNKR